MEVAKTYMTIIYFLNLHSPTFQKHILHPFGVNKKSLVGRWFQPSWKNICQNGNLPQIEVKITKYLKPPPRSNREISSQETLHSDIAQSQAWLDNGQSASQPNPPKVTAPPEIRPYEQGVI